MASGTWACRMRSASASSTSWGRWCTTSKSRRTHGARASARPTSKSCAAYSRRRGRICTTARSGPRLLGRPGRGRRAVPACAPSLPMLLPEQEETAAVAAVLVQWAQTSRWPCAMCRRATSHGRLSTPLSDLRGGRQTRSSTLGEDSSSAGWRPGSRAQRVRVPQSASTPSEHLHWQMLYAVHITRVRSTFGVAVPHPRCEA
mmetsp:Transcript_145935/g.466350  ORF Transcript_145935/g.466350 Transcript_145935/m.466350 type:complete len:202 (-) Transcript_145935:120-725(-)